MRRLERKLRVAHVVREMGRPRRRVANARGNPAPHLAEEMVVPGKAEAREVFSKLA